MNILQRISVIALFASFFYETNGQATCALSWDDGTVLPETNWNFGFILNNIDDVTDPGTVLINMTATSITSISSIVVDSNSNRIFMQPSLSNGRFTVTLTDYFTQYEELETATSILVTVNFVCSVNTRSLQIYQPITDTNNHYPEFQNAPYAYELPMPFPSGFSVQLFGAISARDIDLTNTNISFTLNSSDANSAGFSASWLSQDRNDVKLHHAQLLTTALLDIENDVTFNLYATDNGVPSLTSVTNITISVDEVNSVPTSPVFTYPLYIADYSDTTIEEASGTFVAFNQGNVSLSQGAGSTVEYTIVDNIGNYANNFRIIVSEDYSHVSISFQNVTEELLAEKYVILTLTATRSGAVNLGSSILHIILPGIICPVSTTTTESTTTVEQTTTSSTPSINVTDQTTTVWQCPEVIECTTVTTEYVPVTECPTVVTECPEVTDCPTLTTEHIPITECPTVTTECPEVTDCPILTTDECACDCTTTTTSPITGNSSATTEGVTIASTEATTECPVVTVTQECDCTETTTAWISTTSGTNDTSTTTTQSPGNNSTTVTTQSTEDDGSVITTVSSQNDTWITSTTIPPSLSFSSSVYIFEKDSTFTGVLMTQTAVITNAEGDISYSTSFDEDDLASRIVINANTAELQVTATIDPGTHTFRVIATVEELNLNTSTTVVLIISALTECNDETVFSYALQIIELEEELVHRNVLPLDDNGCNYNIYSQTPDQDLFYISDNYLNTVAIDREASYFSGMTVAQVRVVIDVNCPNETSNGIATTRAKRDTVYEVLTDNIAYIRTRTILVAIITDTNDNAPVWSSDTPTHIGFPSYDLAQLIQVPYVYKFSATDADIDDNAIIIYTLPSGSNDSFYVHDSAGTLYIQQGVYAEDGLEITLIATDGQFETSTNVTVKTLESQNMVVLFISGGVLEDITDILGELSNSTGYWVQSLNSAVISESDTSSSRNSRSLRSITRTTKVTSRPTLLRLVLYGLYNNEPVPSETLVSALGNSAVTWQISELVTLESILSSSTEAAAVDSTDTRGFWAAIIILLLILIAVLVAAGILYYSFSRRNKPSSIESNVTYENFDNPRPNGNTGNLLVKSVTLSESQDHVSESTDSTNTEWVLNQMKKPEKSIYENNRTFNLPNDGNGDDIFITNNESTANTSPQLSKRKSVAFNNTVEEIEVARL